MTATKSVHSAERRAAAKTARAVAQRLRDMAYRIETISNPREEIDAVHRARAALRRLKPETIERLLVLEAIHRGFEVQRLAMNGKPSLANLGRDSLAVSAARSLYRDVAVPGSGIPDDPGVWAELMAAWQKGPGAPAKGSGGDKWKALEAALTKHLDGAPVAGSTLKSQWIDWCKTSDHIPKKRSLSVR